MADNQVVEGGHPAMDYAEHEATYRMFLSLAKGVVVFVVLLMIFMALFLL